MDGAQTERRINGRRVYSGRVLSLEVDRVRLEDGTETVREVVHHHGAIVVVPLVGEDVLLVRQFRYATGGIRRELPAGTLEMGEEPVACARRELAEETGHSSASLTHLASFYSAPGYSTELVHCFLAERLEPVTGVRADEDERIEVVRLPLTTAARLIADGQIRDAKTVAGVLLAVRWHEG
jgi:ADP-ribose pyrophosphatase